MYAVIQFPPDEILLKCINVQVHAQRYLVIVASWVLVTCARDRLFNQLLVMEESFF